MKEKVKNFTINAVKIILLIIVWAYLFHSCNHARTYESGYDEGYERGYERGYEEGQY